MDADDFISESTVLQLAFLSMLFVSLFVVVVTGINTVDMLIGR